MCKKLIWRKLSSLSVYPPTFLWEWKRKVWHLDIWTMDRCTVINF